MPDQDQLARVRASFARQTVMDTIGATLEHVEPGRITIALPVSPRISQQHGFVHAGIVSTIADSACGYAAFSLMRPGAGVLTVEFKVNLMSPASGSRLIAEGRVVRAGRTLTVCQAEVFAETRGDRKTVALMTATLMTIEGRDDVVD